MPVGNAHIELTPQLPSHNLNPQLQNKIFGASIDSAHKQNTKGENMSGNAFARIVQICVAGFILGGCAIGQRFSYQSATVPMPRVASTVPVAIAVQDKRSYIVSHNKPESFVGLMRGGFGNPFDVNTTSGQPMAIEMREAIVNSMRAKGIDVKAVTVNPDDGAEKVQRALITTGAGKLVLVTLNEWKSDTMLSTALIYDVTVLVMNEKGAELARVRSNGRDNIGPSPHNSVPPAFSRKFEALFDDEKIVQALK